ncbi:hypothetical protein ACPA9J_00410 [Pseudomonas aeruginosa]
MLSHEYIDAPLRNGPTVVDGKRTGVADECAKEINALGVSVVEIRRNVRGEWNVVPIATKSPGSPRHADTYRRPGARVQAAAHRHSPDQHPHPRHPLTTVPAVSPPGGTYLTCENWVGYFSRRTSCRAN